MRTDSGVSAYGADMSPSQTVASGSPEGCDNLEGVVVGGSGRGKNSDMLRELANVAAKGRLSNDWHDETIDDDELRLGPK